MFTLLPHVEKELASFIFADPKDWQEFIDRLQTHSPSLFNLYFGLYSTRYGFLFHLEDLLISLARAWFQRPLDLRMLDKAREANPLWFQSNQMLGGVCYVNLFANNNDVNAIEGRVYQGLKSSSDCGNSIRLSQAASWKSSKLRTNMCPASCEHMQRSVP